MTRLTDPSLSLFLTLTIYKFNKKATTFTSAGTSYLGHINVNFQQAVKPNPKFPPCNLFRIFKTDIARLKT